MRLKKRMITLLTAALMLTGFVVWQNNDLTVSSYEAPVGLDNGIHVVHLSDLHSKSFGEDNRRLVDHVLEEDPDMIVITGDLIDQDDEAIADKLTYIEPLSEIAPVYIVSGNHEYWAGLSDEIRDEVENQGAFWMDGRAETLTLSGETFQLIGLGDPESGENLENTFAGLVDEDLETLVLSHRPVTFDWLHAYDVAMVFSGHVHGGQVRLPFIGGLYGPDQGLFPKYDSGVYHEVDAAMVVSRGLGNSVFPLRVFNRPEIVVITLK